MSSDRYDRQSFLGSESDSTLAACRVGIVGLGGGGSHIVQQLAHLGVRRFALYDPDRVEESNLNRLIGATLADAGRRELKVNVASRRVGELHADAMVDAIPARWQTRPDPLRVCDVIIGCVDGLRERDELERCARRFLIPYVDIGLDVHRVGEEPPRMAGQVMLSAPGGPCLRCYGFLTDESFAQEAAAYGAAGARPQVVWANGVLASIAVGLVVDLLTDWTGSRRSQAYMSYDANLSEVRTHPRSSYIPAECAHHPPHEIGVPVIRAV